MLSRSLIDAKRHKSDAFINSQIAERLSSDPEETEIVFWKDIAVGDFLRVQKDQEVPADIVLLATSDDSGFAFVETSNIDGEANLKLKKAVRNDRFGPILTSLRDLQR